MNTDIMYEALGKARDMFKLYAELHRAKGTVDSDAKAKVNEDMVAIMNEALSVHPDVLPELPVSEAFSLTRSVYTADDMYAYARAAIASRDAEIAKLRQPEPKLGDRFMEILRTIHGDMPDAFADSARLAFVHAVEEHEPVQPLSDEDMANCGLLSELRLEEERRAEWHAEMRRDAFGDKT